MEAPLASPLRKLCACLMAASLLAVAAPAFATDVDGPGDCVRNIHEFGDAPEIVLAYPGVPGRFPTCTAPSPAGTQTIGLGCAPISTPPGVTGYVAHFQIGGPPDNYWIGCYPGPMGIDSEPDGKVNTPPIGFSACSPIPTDCVEATMVPFLGLAWDQDECYGDGSDAGLTTPPSFTACSPGSFTIPVWNCDFNVNVPKFLNVLLDMNMDGDWNDTFAPCAPPAPAACAFEWAVKNSVFLMLPGCNTITVPAFPVGPKPGPGWLRLTITDFPVPDDFPWNGSAGLGPDGQFQGGETEDYPVIIQGQVAAIPSTWGGVKATYR